MARKEAALPTDGAVRQGREVDHAAELIGSHLMPSLAQQQAGYLERRFLLAPPLARAVAALYFGRAAA